MLGNHLVMVGPPFLSAEASATDESSSRRGNELEKVDDVMGGVF